MGIGTNRSIQLPILTISQMRITSQLLAGIDGADFVVVSGTWLIAIDFHHVLSAVVNVLSHALVLLTEVAVLFVEHIWVGTDFNAVRFLVQCCWHRLLMLANNTCCNLRILHA